MPGCLYTLASLSSKRRQHHLDKHAEVDKVLGAESCVVACDCLLIEGLHFRCCSAQCQHQGLQLHTANVAAVIRHAKAHIERDRAAAKKHQEKASRLQSRLASVLFLFHTFCYSHVLGTQ